MLEHKMEIILGDWSNDGHGITESYFIESNVTWSVIQEGYMKAIGIIGFDLSAHVCTDYEESNIDEEYVQKLVDNGFFLDDGDGNNYILDNMYLDSETFLDIYMFFVEKGLKSIDVDFKWKMAIDSTQQLRIGGYGLFY